MADITRLKIITYTGFITSESDTLLHTVVLTRNYIVNMFKGKPRMNEIVTKQYI